MFEPRLYLNDHLSPDPSLDATDLRDLGEGWQGLRVYPHALAASSVSSESVVRWVDHLHVHRDPGPLRLHDLCGQEVDLVFDFGTELEAIPMLQVRSESGGSVALFFGESLLEAKEWGLATTCAEQRPRKQHWHIDGAGSHRREVEQGGFRFMRVRIIDFRGGLDLQVSADARFMFERPAGAFRTDDQLLQRIWEASVYTARLCTRPDAYWDGIKRDRMGWYGDARVAQLTSDWAFHRAGPALEMLLRFPVESWVNDIPIFSFDGIAMLRQVIEQYGCSDPRISEVYARVKTFMQWVVASQVNGEGLIHYAKGTGYQFGIGFTDWSPQPLGGRLEELAPLQFSWLEALRNLRWIAAKLGDGPGAKAYARRADALAPLLAKRFWDGSCGFSHTLNLAEPPETPWRMPLQPGLHYKKSYEEQVAHGPSAMSLHSAAKAVFAGLVDERNQQLVLEKAFQNPELPQIITGFYWYFVAMAQASCGDPAGALEKLKSFFGAMLEENDAATVWESFEPDVTGLRRYSLGGWPKSLCHGWGSGTVPFVQHWLLGLRPLDAGWRRVQIAPAQALSCITFSATVPTPLGPIEVERSTPEKPVQVRLPQGIEARKEQDGAPVELSQ